MKVKQKQQETTEAAPKKGLFRGLGRKGGKEDGAKEPKKKGLLGRRQKKEAASVDARNDVSERDSRSIEEEKESKIKTMLMGSDADVLTNLMSDKRQVAATYEAFNSDPYAVIHVTSGGDMPEPETQNHVIIKVQASSVTLGDCFLRRGYSFDLIHPSTLPATPGHDVVGNVVTCGTKVNDFKVGDRVAALVRTGGNARYISVPESSLVKVPLALDAAEASAMVTVYTTAYQALKAAAKDAPMLSIEGKKILILGALDSVGQALIQMCNKGKADVYATGPSRKHSYMRNHLGVTPLPEETCQWLPSVEKEMDIVFDGLCFDGLATPVKALKESGQLVCFGHASMLKEKELGLFGAPMSAHMNRFWGKTKSRAKTVDLWENFQSDPETYKKNLKYLFQLLKWDKVKPTIARRITLSEVAKGHAKLEEGSVRGVLVCLPWKRVSPKSVSKQADERES